MKKNLKTGFAVYIIFTGLLLLGVNQAFSQCGSASKQNHSQSNSNHEQHEMCDMKEHSKNPKVQNENSEENNVIGEESSMDKLTVKLNDAMSDFHSFIDEQSAAFNSSEVKQYEYLMEKFHELITMMEQLKSELNNKTKNIQR